jgi:uncharacterized protein YbgA (DUF1722 family)/uncharacterized protein YbbK (DUF523 family)
MPEQTLSSISVGISSCLLGEEVRFDGSHKRSRYITDTLGDYFDFVPFCPEVAAGMGIPRPPVRLQRIDGQIRVRGVRDSESDFTDALRHYADEVSPKLAQFSGYLFKSKSPSCGLYRVKIYSENGAPVDQGSGVYAERIRQHYPALPLEEEGRLMDPVLRENFIEQVFVYHRWREYMQDGMTPQSLVKFHSRHKFIIQSHDEQAYRDLGRLVAEAGKSGLEQRCRQYISDLMTALRKIATPGQHSNVLMHIMGFFKQSLDADDKAELLDLIEEYRQQRVPLIVPITLLKHYLRRFPDEYLANQYYLNPHPKELMLRNHI